MDHSHNLSESSRGIRRSQRKARGEAKLSIKQVGTALKMLDDLMSDPQAPLRQIRSMAADTLAHRSGEVIDSASDTLRAAAERKKFRTPVFTQGETAADMEPLAQEAILSTLRRYNPNRRPLPRKQGEAMNVQKFKKTLDDIKDAEVVHGGAITAYALGRLQ